MPDVPFQVPFVHRFRSTRGVFDPKNPTLADVIPVESGGRSLTLIDAGLAAARPDLAEQIETYLEARLPAIKPATPPLLVPGGEAVKNDPGHLDRLLTAMHDAKLCRRSYAIVVGGGAVLDAVGLAATLVHRGVRLVRVPSTTLAQDDSGVGVKNGVNRFGKKNFLGAFACPWAVINDADLLTSLTERDWRSGFSEAVKVAVLKDPALFEVIESGAARLADRDLDQAEPIIERSARLHLDHITAGGDPFETDTARPLDFGHWSAHRLEALTGFKITHGEAVAIGVALDTRYAVRVGLCEPGLADRVESCMTQLGFDLAHPALAEPGPVLEGLDEFREHLGGRLTITLPVRLGAAVDVHEIDRGRMVMAMNDLLSARTEHRERRSG